MSDLSRLLHDSIAECGETIQSLSAFAEPMERAADAIEQCLKSGHKLLVCGNGGSAADAAHFATEFVIRFISDRPAYPAICLTSDGGSLTAAGNDYGFDEIFARQVAAFGQPGDVLIAITTSGNSRNIQRALEEAKTRGLSTIALLGRDGGTTRGLADIEMIVRSESTARIQEAHMFLLHVLCHAMEEKLAQP
ncbi:MAG TPA: SIS domain-containing protein [Chthoniobacterales bacterium]